MTWTRWSHADLHRHLLDRCLSPRYRSGEWAAGQALLCPYYVPLEGRLGADWGVIVHRESARFSMLTFEHEYCGCPDRVDPGDGPVHVDAPSQLGDTWDVDWQQVCGEMCDDPCPWRAVAR